MTVRLRILALIGVVTAVAALVVVVLLHHGDDRHGRTEGSPSAVPGHSGTRQPAAPRFGLPNVDAFGNRLETPPDPAGIVLPQDPGARPAPQTGNDYLTASPAGMTWEIGWGGAAFGFSRSDGPTRVQAGIASGYADTPQGAGLAAYDALGRALAAPEGVWQRVLADRFVGAVPGFSDRIACSRAEAPGVAKYVVVPEGFRVLAGFRPDFAVVEIAMCAKDGWSYSTWPMAWVGGDWKVRVPDDAAGLGHPVQVASLSGFGVWK